MARCGDTAQQGWRAAGILHSGDGAAGMAHCCADSYLRSDAKMDYKTVRR